LFDHFDNNGKDVNINMYESVFQSLKENSRLLSNIDNALQHTICINKGFESSHGIHDVPNQFLQKERAYQETYDSSLDMTDAYHIAIMNIEKILEDMFHQEYSFADAKAGFGVKSKSIIYDPPDNN